MNWPTTLSCPLIRGYGTEAAASVVRTPFQAGNTKQRRLHKQLPHTMSLSWVFTQAQYEDAVRWMNTYAWEWFTIDLPSALAGLRGKQTVPHSVRFISDFSSRLIRGKLGWYWEVAVTAEWVPPDADFGVHVAGAWIIAKTAADPSTPDWIIAGTSVAPSTPDWITGGTAAAPSSII